MNEEELKSAVDKTMKNMGISQSDLGRALGKERQSIHKTLASSPLNPRSGWGEILDYLGLELRLEIVHKSA